MFFWIYVGVFVEDCMVWCDDVGGMVGIVGDFYELCVIGFYDFFVDIGCYCEFVVVFVDWEFVEGFDVVVWYIDDGGF